MKQYAEHNKVGICHSLRNDDMYVRVYSGGYPYLKDGIILRSNSLTPIYSYGKNYEKGDKKFALFVWTTEKNEDEIEKLFESRLPEVTDEKISETSDKASFVYLD